MIKLSFLVPGPQGRRPGFRPTVATHAAAQPVQHFHPPGRLSRLALFSGLFFPVLALTMLWPAVPKTAPSKPAVGPEAVSLRIDPGLLSNRGGRPPVALAAEITPAEAPERPAVSFNLHLLGTSYAVETSGTTLREGLAQASIFPKAADFIRPSIDSQLSAGMHVYLQESLPVLVYADGGMASHYTLQTTLGQALEEMGVQLGDDDLVEPALDSQILGPTTVRVTRIFQELIGEEETLDYQVLRRPSGDLEVNTEAVVQEGEPGLLKRTFRVGYEDGQEVSRIVEAEWTETEPIDKVILYGTKIIYPTVDTPNGAVRYRQRLRLLATAYDADGGDKSRSNPYFGITATGMRAGFGVVAVDPRVIPLYSRLYIPGYGTAVAGDTGGGIKGDRIDLGFELGQTGRWSTRWVDVYLLY